ncbi:MAG: AraD1 family protein, partial [Pseudomonadota bacterium]
MRIIQYRDVRGRRQVGMVEADGEHAVTLKGIATVYELANTALARRVRLVRLARELATGRRVDYTGLLEAGQVLAPLDHPEPARFLITGTGLTHTGSAAARHKMHTATHGSGAPESDSMKIFRMGIEAGKPAKGKIGVQPEWFFKGTGLCVVAPGAVLPLPAFALAGAEEPEVVGLYIIDAGGKPRRIGYSLGNEFSDHVTEAQNYLYTGHSKLRACSLGPELLLGELPQDVRGKSRVIRNGKTLWEDDFLSGEANMSHSVANLEH